MSKKVPSANVFKRSVKDFSVVFNYVTSVMTFLMLSRSLVWFLCYCCCGGGVRCVVVLLWWWCSLCGDVVVVVVFVVW